MNATIGEKQDGGGPLIILWISITSCIYLEYCLYVSYILFHLKTILCSMDNRIKCHTKIHTESVLLLLFFSLVENISHIYLYPLTIVYS